MFEESPGSTERLSPVQKECLRLVAAGLQSKEIAIKLNRSHRTVDTYISAALPLFGTSDRRVAARLFLESEASRHKGQSPDGADHRLSGISQRLRSQSDDIAQPVISPDEDGRATRRGHLFRRLFQPPPLGGQENALTPSAKFLSIAQVGLIGAMMLLAIVAIMHGLISLLI